MYWKKVISPQVFCKKGLLLIFCWLNILIENCRRSNDHSFLTSYFLTCRYLGTSGEENYMNTVFQKSLQPAHRIRICCPITSCKRLLLRRYFHFWANFTEGSTVLLRILTQPGSRLVTGHNFYTAITYPIVQNNGLATKFFVT